MAEQPNALPGPKEAPMGDLGWGGNEPLWERGARLLLDAVVLNDDEMGHLANATADELRDALRLAARRLRGLEQPRRTARPSEGEK